MFRSDRLKVAMSKLKKILSFVVIILSLINVSEICYFAYIIGENYRELTLHNILITAFINLAGIFFVLTLAIGISQSNEALLKTWMVYAILELSRSCFILYATWANPKDDNFERIFNSCDALVQVLLIATVFKFLQVLKAQRESEKKISMIGRSLAIYEKSRIKK